MRAQVKEAITSKLCARLKSTTDKSIKKVLGIAIESPASNQNIQCYHAYIRYRTSRKGCLLIPKQRRNDAMILLYNKCKA